MEEGKGGREELGMEEGGRGERRMDRENRLVKGITHHTPCPAPPHPLQGIAFLDTVLEVSRKRQWLSKHMDEEIKEWLTMLLSPINIADETAESYLKEFLTTKMGGVTKLYSEHIKRCVSLGGDWFLYVCMWGTPVLGDVCTCMYVCVGGGQDA